VKVAIGSDHAGFEVKEKLRSLISSLGHEPADMGTDSQDSCDYPDYAKAVAESVARGESGCGMLVCGTGIGMSMAANKVRGIRAAKVCSEYESQMSRRHNNANILCLGARSLDYDAQIRPIVEAWFATDFEGGRHARRVDKILALEG
jgi:ribose 5-phosphate isomerase B